MKVQLTAFAALVILLAILAFGVLFTATPMRSELSAVGLLCEVAGVLLFLVVAIALRLAQSRGLVARLVRKPGQVRSVYLTGLVLLTHAIAFLGFALALTFGDGRLFLVNAVLALIAFWGLSLGR